MGSLAGVFGFTPSELWEFTADDFDFWLDRAEEWGDARSGKNI